MCCLYVQGCVCVCVCVCGGGGKFNYLQLINGDRIKWMETYFDRVRNLECKKVNLCCHKCII